MSPRRLYVLVLCLAIGAGAFTALPGATAQSKPHLNNGAHVTAELPWQIHAASRTTEAAGSSSVTQTLATSAAGTVKQPAVSLTAQTPPFPAYGDDVHLSGFANLTKLPVGGTMVFYDGKTPLGSSAVDSGGFAELNTTTLRAGSHSLTAAYKTDPRTSTTSPVVSLVIAKRPLELFAEAPYYTRPVGAANPPFHVALWPYSPTGGLVNGDTLLGSVTGKPTYSTATARSTPSVYPVVLSGLSSVNYQIVYRKSAITVYSKDLHVGDTVPNATGKDQNGANVSLAGLHGKEVLLDLSTIWCSPSAFMGSQLTDIVSALQQQGTPFAYLPVQLEGASPGVGGTQANALNFAHHFDVPGWVHVLHPQGLEPAVGQPLPPLWDLFYSFSAQLTHDTGGGGAFPTLVVLNENGVVKEVNLGLLDKDTLIPDLLDLAPDTGVDVTSAPPLRTNATPPSVDFVATPTAPTTCRVDGTAWVPCTTPYEPAGLADGIHEIEISAGRSTNAYVPFVLDTTPPDTTIDSGPGTDAVSFEFSSNDPGASFTCWLDSDTPQDCSSPWYYLNLPGGDHTFHVAATDRFGNVDPTPAEQLFTAQPQPDMTFDITPANPTTADAVTLTATVMDATTADPATGTVTFGDASFGTWQEDVPLTAGVASLNIGQLPAGSQTFFAYYSGDATHGARYVEESTSVSP